MMNSINPRRIYQDINLHNRLVLGVSKNGINFVFLYQTNIYEDINDAYISFLNGRWYACIDRVMFIPWDRVEELYLEEYEKLSYAEYHKIIIAISQFYMGEIIYSDNDKKFMYTEDYKEPKGNLKVKVVSNIKEDDDTDHIDIDTNESDFTTLEFKDKNEEDINYDNYAVNATAEYPPGDLGEIVKNAKNLGFP